MFTNNLALILLKTYYGTFFFFFFEILINYTYQTNKSFFKNNTINHKMSSYQFTKIYKRFAAVTANIAKQ